MPMKLSKSVGRAVVRSARVWIPASANLQTLLRSYLVLTENKMSAFMFSSVEELIARKSLLKFWENHISCKVWGDAKGGNEVRVLLSLLYLKYHSSSFQMINIRHLSVVCNFFHIEIVKTSESW